MTFSDNKGLIRWIIVIASFVIISLILWNTYDFFQKFKAEERTKMDMWAFAQSEFQKNLLSDNINPIIEKIITSKYDTPMLVMYADSQIPTSLNIDEKKIENKNYIEKLIHRFSNENAPILMSYIEPETNKKIILGTLYYGNSPLLNKLKYYPLALLLIILLFGAVAYFFYKSSKNAAQNKLWTGMAKETAHQIGTPLSSLIGWAEILKSEKVNPEYIVEIEKDINRLETITERFSKIGSIPTLIKTDVVNETITSYEYLKARTSKLIDFNLTVPDDAIYVKLNSQLYSWTIENLVKNAIDAMKGKGKLLVEIIPSGNDVKINITDTGKGLSKKQFNKIFDPGYTTKKRGWGLGLSLSKRIIEDYHKGKIKVLSSEINKGSTIQITLKSI